MFRARAAAALTAVTAVATLSIATAAVTHAASCDRPINGTYTATSDGQWAKTREVFHDEATVVTAWTITSACDDVMHCAGQGHQPAGLDRRSALPIGSVVRRASSGELAALSRRPHHSRRPIFPVLARGRRARKFQRLRPHHRAQRWMRRQPLAHHRNALHPHQNKLTSWKGTDSVDA